MGYVFTEHLKKAIEAEGMNYEEWLENYIKNTREDPKEKEGFVIPEPKKDLEITKKLSGGKKE